MRVEMEWGYVDIGPTNEVSVVSTVDDPPKVRVASKSKSKGAVSFNHLRDDGVQEEMILVQGKSSEEPGAHFLSGELTIHIRDGNVEGDAGMKRVVELRHNRAWIYGVSLSI